MANGQSCTELQGYAGCHGDMGYLPGAGAVYCDEWGRLVRFGYVDDCPSRGMVCTAAGSCALASPPCAEGETSLCLDSVAVNCPGLGPAGLDAMTDCARLGVACEAGWGCTPGSTLLPCGGEPDRCDGEVLTTCLFTGQPQMVDCAALGLACGADSLGLPACVRP